MYKLTNVSFQIDSKAIVEPLNLSIEKGKVTMLLGHNGCGKTTLMKLLSRHLQATHGSIRLDDRELKDYSHRELALKISYLPQHPPITEAITVRELVCHGRYPWKGAFNRYSQEDHYIVEDAIDKVGLTIFHNRFVSELSGGERQRAWVAMLLAQKSQVILLDEPTSSLDVSHQYELIKLIHQLSKELNLTVIMVLHDINLAARFSDQIIAMHSGRLIIQDSPHNVMNASVLKQIYGMDLALFNHPKTDQRITYIP